MPIDPTRRDLERFATEGPEGPVVMLNLLRFADGGRARYAEYLRAAAPFLAAAGGEVVHLGAGATALVGDAWDAVLLVRYPSRAAFLGMVSDPAYQAITPLRREALADAVLQATTAW